MLAFVERQVAKGKNVPTFYKDYQPMDSLSAWYLQAFRRLCTQEQISLLEIKAYIELFKVHRPVDEFVDCIQALDSEVRLKRITGK